MPGPANDPLILRPRQAAARGSLVRQIALTLAAAWLRRSTRVQLDRIRHDPHLSRDIGITPFAPPTRTDQDLKRFWHGGM